MRVNRSAARVALVDRRRLVVMRHAKAEPFASTDHARRLTARGRADAEAAGEYLGGQGFCPDHVVVSSAVRAVATWERVAQSCVGETEVDVDDAVFTGSIDVVLEALRAVPSEAQTVMFVGHNPVAAYLCHHLDDGHGDPDATHGLLSGLPAGALAVLEMGSPWADLHAESGRVVDFHAPG
jgi:phosphohistidine phosphatase